MRSSSSWKDILTTANEEANRVAQQPAEQQNVPLELEPRHMHDSYTQVGHALSRRFPITDLTI